MILLSGDPIVILYVFGVYVVVFFIVWTILFYLFEKVNVFNITNKFLRRVSYFSLAIIAGILSFFSCKFILDFF